MCSVSQNIDFECDDYYIRRMEEKDIIGALICFGSHGLYDSISSVQAFYEYDPNAFYVAISKSDGKLTSNIKLVPFSSQVFQY
jgi:hypothetical protein